MASKYTDEQIDRYLEYVSMPPSFRRDACPSRDLDFLTELHAHQISAIPYENLSLHYSQDHKVDLDPQKLYHKLTVDGRGGYCMENSIFFNHVLRALGFHVYTAGVRIRPRVNGEPQGNYMGWVHVVNIVTLASGDKYMIEVGFGGDGATVPIPLKDGHVTKNLGAQEVRLVYDNIPTQVDKSQKLWIYQYRNGQHRAWNSYYCFPETEFLEADFHVMNYFASTSAESFQTFTIVAVKFLRRERTMTSGKPSAENMIYGKVMLVNGEVKENMGGKTSTVKTCLTEGERVEALKSHFGITLTNDEIEGIRGTVAELPRGGGVPL